MNEILNKMIQSLLKDAQEQVNIAVGTTSHVWTAHMVASIILQSTARALIEAKDAMR